MKKNNFLFCALVFLASLNVSADQLGAGIILFGPSGFSGNYIMGKNSIDAAMSWSLNDNDQKFYIHSTYLWRNPAMFKLEKFPINVHYGVGGRLVSWDDPPGKDRESDLYMGIRGAGGVYHVFKKQRIEVLAELSVTMDVVPETDADVDFAIAGRYYFK